MSQKGGGKGDGDCNIICHRHDKCNPVFGLGHSKLIRAAAVVPLISHTGVPAPKTSDSWRIRVQLYDLVSVCMSRRAALCASPRLHLSGSQYTSTAKPFDRAERNPSRKG